MSMFSDVSLDYVCKQIDSKINELTSSISTLDSDDDVKEIESVLKGLRIAKAIVKDSY